MQPTPSVPEQFPTADPGRYRSFLLELLGVMAYGELSAFERLSSDARFSPTLTDRATLGQRAVSEFLHYELIAARLEAMEADVEDTMRPFVVSIDAFHDRTRPADWYESIMKAYVIDAISADFYRALSRHLDPATQKVIADVQVSEAQSTVLMNRLKQALVEHPKLPSRLALWGRRLVGEALTQAQRIGIERAFLEGLIGDPNDADAAGADRVSKLFSDLTRAHSRRMNLLGLTA
ncbi:ferritin-like fold-containing protein [Arthrobacter sp. H14]|uniref:ferritin-like fold-containing protein n=1 Tax=Arthrobacter sp. H14 TaxID=1312959 RepID=UPI0004BAE3C0|nr:ferritin-like fold-containing protein [Arthrobacter sp. H14]